MLFCFISYFFIVLLELIQILLLFFCFMKYLCKNIGNWNHVSAPAKDLVRKMLDLDPAKRLTTAQVIAHPWILQRHTLPENQLAMQDARLVKGAVAATYRAISSSPLAPHLAPVQTSQLAMRRRKSRPKTTTDV